ncbi:MAG: hypothetical protein WCH61_02610 [bacterium]
MNSPSESTPAPKPASLQMALLCSSAGFPGAGQALQKRWGAAVFYALGFGGAFLWLMGVFAWFMLRYYQMGMNADLAGDNTTPVFPWIQFGVSLLLSGGLYLLNLVDVFLAHRRQARKDPPPLPLN